MRRSIIAALLIAGALALPAASQADPVKIRIAWITIGNPPPVLEAKKDLAHVAADFGFLKEHIDLAKYTDLSIMEDAVKRVGAVK